MSKLPVPKRMRLGESHRRSRQQESEAAGRFGGRTVKGSGSGYVKGDVRNYGVCRIEAKTTKHSSFRVTVEMIDKLEAAVHGSEREVPVLEVELQGGKRRVYVVPADAIDLVIGATQEP